MSKQSFEEKVRSMSPRAIVMAMVEGLRNPKTVVDMADYGSTDRQGGKLVCYGCAATNTVLKIAGVRKLGEWLDDCEDRALKLKSDQRFLGYFESAINGLRNGSVFSYNSYAARIGIAQLAPWPTSLPRLTNDNYLHNLKWYEEFAMAQSDVREVPDVAQV